MFKAVVSSLNCTYSNKHNLLTDIDCFLQFGDASNKSLIEGWKKDKNGEMMS